MKSMTKKNNLSRVALLATLISLNAYATEGIDNETSVQDYGAFVYAVEKNFSDFFNPGNKTPFSTFIVALEKLFNDFTNKTNNHITRNNDSALAKSMHDLIDYTNRQFTIACTIMKKYSTKPASEAVAFGTEIKRDFSPEKVFAEIVVKLRAIRCIADKANESSLVKKIDIVITMIEKKRKEWGTKSEFTLVGGLAHRMNCK